MPTKRTRKKMSLAETAVNKTLLFILAIIFGAATLIGYAINVLVGTVFMILFAAIVGVIIDLPRIEMWLDKNLNDRKW